MLLNRSRPDRDFRNRTGPDRIGTPDPVDRTGPDTGSGHRFFKKFVLFPSLKSHVTKETLGENGRVLMY